MERPPKIKLIIAATLACLTIACQRLEPITPIQGPNATPDSRTNHFSR